MGFYLRTENTARERERRGYIRLGLTTYWPGFQSTFCQYHCPSNLFNTIHPIHFCIVCTLQPYTENEFKKRIAMLVRESSFLKNLWWFFVYKCDDICSQQVLSTHPSRFCFITADGTVHWQNIFLKTKICRLDVLVQEERESRIFLGLFWHKASYKMSFPNNDGKDVYFI